jgi:hypothetical protein
MHQKLEDFHTPTTAGNIKENVNTLYNSRNTAKKQLEPLQPSSDQSENQALDITPRFSPKPEIQDKYIDMFNLGPNQNPAREPLAYD